MTHGEGSAIRSGGSAAPPPGARGHHAEARQGTVRREPDGALRRLLITYVLGRVQPRWKRVWAVSREMERRLAIAVRVFVAAGLLMVSTLFFFSSHLAPGARTVLALGVFAVFCSLVLVRLADGRLVVLPDGWDDEGSAAASRPRPDAAAPAAAPAEPPATPSEMPRAPRLRPEEAARVEIPPLGTTTRDNIGQLWRLERDSEGNTRRWVRISEMPPRRHGPSLVVGTAVRSQLRRMVARPRPRRSGDGQGDRQPDEDRRPGARS